MTCLLFWLLVVGFVCLHVLSDRAWSQRDEEDRRALAHLPPDTQVSLWAARCRHDLH